MPPPGIEAEWLDAKPIIAVRRPREPLRVQIERKRDWFGIDGELKVEPGAHRARGVLDAARRQQRFVRVDDDRWVELSRARCASACSAVADRRSRQARLELSPGAVPAIRALLDAGAEVEAAPRVASC